MKNTLRVIFNLPTHGNRQGYQVHQPENLEVCTLCYLMSMYGREHGQEYCDNFGVALSSSIFRAKILNAKCGCYSSAGCPRACGLI